VLPPRLMAGHPATLAVLGADGKLASGVTVDLGNGQTVTTDRTGRALFNVPALGDYLLAKAPGATVATLVDPAVEASEPQVNTLPAVVSMRDRFWICGAGLRGEADANSVNIDGQPAVVLAASPECLVVLPGPTAKPGPVSISVEAPGVKWSVTTTLVSLEFEAPNPALQPGHKGQLIVRVRGSSEKLGLVVQNRTPTVLRFLRGDEQSVVTDGSSKNFAAITVQAVTSGDFAFRARLVSSPDPATAARYLLAAERLAPKELQREILDLSQRLEHHPRSLHKVRADLDQIVAKTPVGDLRILMDAARESL
jgi:hypothetical protein